MPVANNNEEQRDVFFRQLINLEFEIEQDIDELRQFAGPLTTMQQASTQIKSKLNKLHKKIKVCNNAHVHVHMHAHAQTPDARTHSCIDAHARTRTRRRNIHAREHDSTYTAHVTCGQVFFDHTHHRNPIIFISYLECGTICRRTR